MTLESVPTEEEAAEYLEQLASLRSNRLLSIETTLSVDGSFLPHMRGKELKPID